MSLRSWIALVERLNHTTVKTTQYDAEMRNDMTRLTDLSQRIKQASFTKPPVAEFRALGALLQKYRGTSFGATIAETLQPYARSKAMPVEVRAMLSLAEGEVIVFPTRKPAAPRDTTPDPQARSLPVGTWVCIIPSSTKRSAKFGTIAGHGSQGGSIVNVTDRGRNVRYHCASYQLRRATQDEIAATMARGVVKPRF